MIEKKKMYGYDKEFQVEYEEIWHDSRPKSFPTAVSKKNWLLLNHWVENYTRHVQVEF